ncbi:hypothetical protein MC7420_8195 [Coleofasciculus chthonoplastes PCC 7420]|uniref:Uncharacterized protein n=1 Tax=Coleofasciculus chthonoplastes PCC 7420 TaxID=118168 RepID=B4W4F1_9CYAN|nr:hypothetical protein MC7420_8195 [Coleofasciculus chthonoplastes PCC 7420]
MDSASPEVTQLQGFQPHLKSQRAKLGCSLLTSLSLRGNQLILLTPPYFLLTLNKG